MIDPDHPGQPLAKVTGIERDVPVVVDLAAALPCRRLLAVGTNMAVGKVRACLSLLEADQRSEIPARFVGTGQAEILISGEGVALNVVRVDYAAGAVEAAVLWATETLANWARPDGAGEPASVAAVALNTACLDEGEEVEHIRQTLDLPCTDPIGWGAESLLRALLNC